MRRFKPRCGTSGMTLIEVVIAVSIFTIVMGALYSMSFGFGDTADVQLATNINMDEVRGSLQVAVAELRQAARQSINFADLPGNEIRYRIPVDLDGNGTAVDISKRIELGTERIIRLDSEDLNGDGLTNTQLVLIEDGQVLRVIANNLNAGMEATDADGVFGPEQDTNGNGRLDRGFWIAPRDAGLVVGVQARRVSSKGHEFILGLDEFVVPRN